MQCHLVPERGPDSSSAQTVPAMRPRPPVLRRLLEHPKLTRSLSQAVRQPPRRPQVAPNRGASLPSYANRPYAYPQAHSFLAGADTNADALCLLAVPRLWLAMSALVAVVHIVLR